jgi:hypothetical protein
MTKQRFLLSLLSLLSVSYLSIAGVTLLVGQPLSTTRALLAPVKTIIVIILFINNNFYFYFLNFYFLKLFYIIRTVFFLISFILIPSYNFTRIELDDFFRLDVLSLMTRAVNFKK